MSRHFAASRLPFAVTAAVGVALLAVTLGTSQLSASSAADELVDLTAPVVTKPGVERMRSDLERAEAAAAALGGAGIDRLAELSGLSRAQLAERHPEVGRGLAELPEIQRLADAVVTNLERRRGQFESAASLPGLGLTLHAAVWAQLALATLVVLLGVAGVLRPARMPAAAILGIGVLLVVAPLALGHPAKAADTDAVLNSLRPFSAEKVRARASALDTARELFEGFERAAAEADLAAASPLLSQPGLDEIDAILDRFGALVAFSARIQPLLVEADTISARAAMWLILGPGILLVLAGGAAYVGSRPVGWAAAPIAPAI